MIELGPSMRCKIGFARLLTRRVHVLFRFVLSPHVWWTQRLSAATIDLEEVEICSTRMDKEGLRNDGKCQDLTMEA